ncbi:helix-turn-helix transcriptional regulator [Nocardia sp. NPDC050697]|uniref:helix-turn-helix domain-containing protein n=1 Tax=Nocardia sp. NPDC050697 TaxID=3155158 RepID=UPI003400F802
MSGHTVGERIAEAIDAAGLSQRELAAATGISQPTLSRTISGDRVAKMNELISIAAATGWLLTEFTGTSRAAAQVQCAARAANGASMESMRAQMLHFIELDAYLDDQAIPAVL